MTEEQFKSLIKLAILELMEEHRDLFRELVREALRESGTRPAADAEPADEGVRRAEEAAKREEILKLIGTTI
jgi:Asp-tRNA(Asn)/Glu-tRNA(Gln) amidotransferase C subunit